ncbi:hypothetical protein FBBAL38_03885 [Flavobacteria bacterium BAL38]|nr:hypothetical protein FBBAL38_03885 [Flavobacteria bacterium BAL38]
MAYLKFIQYIYLAFAIFSFGFAYFQWKANEDFVLPIIVGFVSIGMFFFRRHFHNKYQKKQ